MLQTNELPTVIAGSPNAGVRSSTVFADTVSGSGQTRREKLSAKSDF
jgi:hypothetical protein